MRKGEKISSESAQKDNQASSAPSRERGRRQGTQVGEPQRAEPPNPRSQIESNRRRIPQHRIESREPAAMAAEKPAPVRVLYCGVCGLPAEYCEFGPDFERCKPWLRAHAPGVYPDELIASSSSGPSRGLPPPFALPAGSGAA